MYSAFLCDMLNFPSQWDVAIHEIVLLRDNPSLLHRSGTVFSRGSALEFNAIINK